MNHSVIRVKGLVNRFGEQTVHDHLDFEIEAGEIIGIVGGSGSGKSVLLRTMIGLHPPTAGKVEIDGDKDGNPSEWGVLFQNGALFSNFTVVENIMMPLREHTYIKLEDASALARLKLALVGIKEEAYDKKPSELSGGMKKRVALARALSLDPEIIFLDEPTAGLDPIAAAEFDELIKNLHDALNLTVVMITHDLDTLFTLCDRVAVLVDKKIRVGNLQAMLNDPHPWIQKYFHGPRSRAALASQNAAQ